MHQIVFDKYVGHAASHCQPTYIIRCGLTNWLGDSAPIQDGVTDGVASHHYGTAEGEIAAVSRQRDSIEQIFNSQDLYPRGALQIVAKNVNLQRRLQRSRLDVRYLTL